MWLCAAFPQGGHLACSLGVMWDDPELLKRYDNHGGKNRPDAMILGYPVITADEYAHVESLENVSGCRRGTPGYAYFSLDRHVNERTCPAFFCGTLSQTIVCLRKTAPETDGRPSESESAL